jgi:hypothetical protein
VTLSTPTVTGATAAGRKLFYRIRFKVAVRSKLPSSVQASVRWDPLDPATGGSASTTGAGAGATTGPGDAQPDFGLIVPERLGDIVAPRKVAVTTSKMSFHVRVPSTPGRYRLTVTLHDAEGVAYDAATQAMVSPLIVRVTGDHDAGVVAPDRLELAPGQAERVLIWVANLGKSAWGKRAGPDRTTFARLTGTWLALGGLDDPDQQAAAAAAAVTPVELPAGVGPRAVVKAQMRMFAPSVPGDYLVVLDILTPEVGSLSAQGVDPTIIRVHVAEPEPTPSQGLPAIDTP